jgi:hypothetical protein
MYAMNYRVMVGDYSLRAIERIDIIKSVENLADVATIFIPGTYINQTLDLEKKLSVGNEVEIYLGYDKEILEFKGFLKSIETDNGLIRLECEDLLWMFRNGIPDAELLKVSVKTLLQHVVKETGFGVDVSCDYEFKYDKFVILRATGWDVLKKVQDETRANIFFRDNVLHVHPQYKDVFNEEPVVYDFSRNVETSNLKYRQADERKYLVEVEGIKPDGTRIKTTAGKSGGEKRSIKIYGVTDDASLKAAAEEQLAMVVYTGFEGSFTGWLVPYVEPGYKITLIDENKRGDYYVVAVETKFGSGGGVRTVTIGKKL